MGSGNSRNAVVSPTTKEGNARQRTGTRRLFHSRCFCPFAELPDNASNSTVRDRKYGRPVVPTTRAQVRQESNSGKQLNTKNVKVYESYDSYKSITSTASIEKSRKRHIKRVSNASSSSMRDSMAPELESSTRFNNHSSTRSKVTKHKENNYCFSFPSSNADHSTVQSRRSTGSGSLESYSIFTRSLRQQCSNVDLDQGSNVDDSLNDTTTQQRHGNELCAVSEIRSRHHRNHSVQRRQGQYADLSLNSTEWRDVYSESSSMTQNDYMGSGEAMSRNDDHSVSILRRSSSMRLESREARRIQSRYGTPEHIERNARIRRTHSVGHLRDRTVRQESSEGLLTMLDGDSMDREIRQHDGRRSWDSLRRSASHRQVATQVPFGQDQFVHTLRSLNDNRRQSGHLRDRTLRRESSEGLLTVLDGDSMDRELRQHNSRRPWDSLRRSSSHRQVATQVPFGQDQFVHTLRSLSDNRRRSDEIYQINQEATTDSGNFVEQRSLSLEERRCRARSQVRALQHLGNNFGNLAGHQRACLLAGHYHTGRCSCQNIGPTDESTTRANISRIIMLAEALFEVLDEIHTQSMALSSRASVVSLGPFPAPDYVVESMPVRIYKQCEIVTSVEPAQCYICLMEYEEGDHMRVLPCHHEFHLTCIDKWLKEIHRVCPLCRGNVCDVGFANHTRAL